MTRQRWWLPCLVAGAVVAAVVSPVGGAAAAPATGSSTPGSSAASSTASTVSTSDRATAPTVSPDALARDGGTKVTLVTGDVVSYKEGSDGTPQVEVASGDTTLDTNAGSYEQERNGDDFYVIPRESAALVSAGKLDKELFNVAYLAKNGYADKATGELPVIVQYPKAARSARAPAGRPTLSRVAASAAAASALSQRADALPATPQAHGLSAINAAAVTVTKAQAGKFWSAVEGQGQQRAKATTLGSGVEKIWLDRKARAVLDVSVPQVGAPQAWQAGYDGSGVTVAVLDTGIDATHPDFEGKIVDSRSFIEGEDVKDGHGHGTHVASTIVGSGAASGGRYKGVAPGAKLIVGKVLDNTGNGVYSGIIEGMQWAAESGARVVSISIGAGPSDGTDIMSQAVDELSAQYGTLFVIAAGNDGRSGPFFINAPGTADAALTVAAVDKQDQLAWFSSRGPRVGNYGLKPDIAAPGQDITAAKADGTSLAPTVDEKYMTISGTSMATPHVSGAAVILAQEHPDWTGQKLKAVLTSSSRDDGFAPNEQGAGRLDIPRAISQQVYAEHSVDFGQVPQPWTTVSRPVTYTNDGDEPVTLNLQSRFAALRGDYADGIFTVTPQTLTVPAHGTADATVTFDATKAPKESWYSGLITATDAAGSVRVATTVGGAKGARMVTVTAKVINRDDAQSVDYGNGFLVIRQDDADVDGGSAARAPGPEHTGQLPAGHYTFAIDVVWWDSKGNRNSAIVANPAVDATHDTTVTFDLRKARPLSVRTPKPAVPYRTNLRFEAGSERSLSPFGNQWLGFLESWPYSPTTIWTLPNQPAGPRDLVSGTFDVLLGQEPVTMSLQGARNTRLHPVYDSMDISVAKFDGRRRLPVVSVGHGTAEELALVNVRGALALFDFSDLCPIDSCTDTATATARISAAAQAGATGALAFAPRRTFLDHRSPRQQWGPFPIPTLSLPADEGRMLLDRLSRGQVTVDVVGTPTTPYVYPLSFFRHDGLPGPEQTVTERQLTKVVNRYHSEEPGVALTTWAPLPTGLRAGYPPARQQHILRTPAELTAYVGPVTDDVLWQTSTTGTYAGPPSALAYAQYRYDLHTRTGSRIVDWNELPVVANSVPADPRWADMTWTYCAVCRAGDRLDGNFSVANNGEMFGYTPGPNLGAVAHLYRDGVEVPRFFEVFGQRYFWDLPAQPGNYKLDLHSEGLPSQKYSRSNETSWTFASQPRDTGYGADDVHVVPGLLCMPWFMTDAGAPVEQTKKCNPTEQVFLDYDLGLGLSNTVPAGRTHTFTITGRHHALLVDAPAVTSMAVSVSVDDGAHWSKARVRAVGRGTYAVTVTYPKLSRTSGAVSLRVQAADAHGNTITQTVPRAYGLSAGTDAATPQNRNPHARAT